MTAEFIEKLRSVKPYTPLSAVRKQFSGDIVDDDIFRLAEGGYLRLVPYDEKLTSMSEPCVTRFLWAPDDSAMRRIVNHDIEGDRGEKLDVPQILLPPGARDSTFAAVKAAMVSLLGASMFESAKYRIGTDGAFFVRELSDLARFYYFRKRSGRTDRAFAAEFALTDLW